MNSQMVQLASKRLLKNPEGKFPSGGQRFQAFRNQTTAPSSFDAAVFPLWKDPNDHLRVPLRLAGVKTAFSGRFQPTSRTHDITNVVASAYDVSMRVGDWFRP